MDALYGHSCGRCGGFSNAAEHRITFSPEALNNGLRSIFSGFDVKNDIQQDIFKETLRLFNQAAAKGISQNYDEKAITDEFLEQIRHNNEIFSVFRTHKMQNDIAKQLLNGNGQLKSYDQFRRDVAPLTGKYCDQWLNTEYNTAVIRAHRAADWKHFETEKDVYPNLMWMPTTSVTPDPVHQSFWERQLTLPVDDPFWGHHHPGERWGCKCTCEQTDAPVNDPIGVSGGGGERTSSKGLAGNPGQTGQLFSEDHPYYPKNCGSCPFNKGVRNRMNLFMNKKKDCESCQACQNVIFNAQLKSSPHYQKNAQLCKDYKANADYKNVEFDSYSGGMKAIHIGHNFDKIKGDYELHVQTVGFHKGHSVIFEKESSNIIGKRFTEGLWDGKEFEIAAVETASENNILRGLKHCASKRTTQYAVLYYPNGGYDDAILKKAINRYRGLAKLHDGQFLKFEKILCVQENTIIEITI